MMNALVRSIIVTTSQYFYHFDETHIEAHLSRRSGCIDFIGIYFFKYIVLFKAMGFLYRSSIVPFTMEYFVYPVLEIFSLITPIAVNEPMVTPNNR